MIERKQKYLKLAEATQQLLLGRVPCQILYYCKDKSQGRHRNNYLGSVCCRSRAQPTKVSLAHQNKGLLTLLDGNSIFLALPITINIVLPINSNWVARDKTGHGSSCFGLFGTDSRSLQDDQYDIIPPSLRFARQMVRRPSRMFPFTIRGRAIINTGQVAVGQSSIHQHGRRIIINIIQWQNTE